MKGGFGVVRITVWNESEHKGKAYPDGMSRAIKEGLDLNDGFEVVCAYLDEDQQGLPDALLNETDVLIWWGHSKHEKVRDDLVEKIIKRVNEGMGIIFLHSAHFSKAFRKLMGTHCSLRWREKEGEAERIWTVDPYHPIARGVEQGFRLDGDEMYGEHFDIPTPDALVFIGWFSGGNVFRSGCTFTRGQGRIFYFQPGHETFPIFYDENIRQIMENACLWAAKKDEGTTDFEANPKCIHERVPLEEICPKTKKKFFGI
ncbi:MAG: trehalose utilization protein ThuA [Clostridiales bacterium]|nr:trehalose utilization protein ThuA [Clostridiales bacterium]